MVTMSGLPAGAVLLPQVAPQASLADLSNRARAYLASRNNGAATDPVQDDAVRDPAVRLTLSKAAMASSPEQTLYQKISSILQDQFGFTPQEGESWEDRIKRQFGGGLGESHAEQLLTNARQLWLDRLGITLEDGETFEDATQRYSDDIKTKMELSAQIRMRTFDIARHAEAHERLDALQKDYNRILNAKPVPPVELKGGAKEAAFDLLSQRGYAKPGPGHSVSFSVDGMVYQFLGDGSVSTYKGDVPTSDAAKAKTLEVISGQIRYAQQDMSAVISERDAMQAQYDALAAKYNPKT